MPLINQPPDFRQIFADLESRLRKLETAVRFTSPNVTTDPTLARTGDIWYNTATNTLKALLTTTVTLVTTGVANTFTALQTFASGLTVSSGNLTATAVTSNLGVTNTSTLGVTGNATINGSITGQVSGATVIEMSNDGNGSIEIGKVNGTPTTPFIDFHTSTTPVDFDVRVIASGDTGVAGGGTLQVQGARFNLSTANVNLASITTATTIGAAGGASALPATPLGYIIIEIGGTQRKIPFYNM